MEVSIHRVGEHQISVPSVLSVVKISRSFLVLGLVLPKDKTRIETNSGRRCADDSFQFCVIRRHPPASVPFSRYSWTIISLAQSYSLGAGVGTLSWKYETNRGTDLSPRRPCRPRRAGVDRSTLPG